MEQKLSEHLSRQGLGTSVRASESPRGTLDKLLAFQGEPLVGERSAGVERVADSIARALGGGIAGATSEEDLQKPQPSAQLREEELAARLAAKERQIREQDTEIQRLRSLLEL